MLTVTSTVTALDFTCSLTPMDPVQPSMAELQEVAYGADRDYAFGSPHLSHAPLRTEIEERLATLVRSQISRAGSCKVLEVGAGHGTFTQALLYAGASVTVTEMSEPSANLLRARYAGNDLVTVVYDPDGTAGAKLAPSHSMVVLVSVLHHIPDYLNAVAKLIEGLPSESAFFCAQDPSWYPSRSRIANAADRGAYLLWRVGQGDYSRGLKTRVRRLRGLYDDSNASDMVEYHVVRQGVNEHALIELLAGQFTTVTLWEYWSTQSRILQRLGDALNLRSTFGISATGRSDTLSGGTP